MKGVGTWESAMEVAEEQQQQQKKRGGGFQSFGLEKPLLDGILRLGYNVPTPIQRRAIPPMMQGNDIVAMARTGSGKTAAFLIPMLHLLKAHSKIVGVRGLILSPTRELSMQILRFGIQISKFLDLRFVALVGGNSLEQQFEMLASNPDIVVATPGRILHIMEEASLQLSMVKSIVLDEADRLFELGLQPQIVAIMQKIPESCQRSLFSATMPSVLAEFTNAGLHNPVVLRLDAEMKLSDKLKQSAFFVRNDEKIAALIVLLKKVIGIEASDKKSESAEKQALVFVESKFHVDYLEAIMEAYHISCSAVHGQMDQEGRRNAVRAFAKRETSVMIVTDVAARGLDLPLLDNVVNFSFAPTPKLFVHRVGRVARAGRSGAAYSILTFEDFPHYVDLMAFLNRPLQCRKEPGDLLFTADDGCYGRMPEDALQLELDFIRRLVQNDVELKGMTKVVENAHKKFARTKKKATHDGIQTARQSEYQFDSTPLHPIFVERLEKKEIAADEARVGLKRFKAKESLLEIVHGEKMMEIKKPVTVQSLWREQRQRGEDKEGSEKVDTGSDKKQGKHESENCVSMVARKNGAVKGSSTMGRKLSLAESLLLKAQERKKREREAVNGEENDDVDGITVFPARAAYHSNSRAGAIGGMECNSDKYRDREFFMEDVKRNTIEDVHYSVKDATFDIGADTAQEAQQRRQVYAWSKKKNRYVRMNVNDAKALLRGVKNEAGKAVNFKTKLKTYSKWTKKSNLRIQDAGEEEDLGPLRQARDAQRQNERGVGDEDDGFDETEEVDISNPNQGKKLRIGRKLRRLPKDGHVRTFEEMALMKRKAAKEKARLERKKQKGKRKR
ncbi:ATP-dependent DEAD/H RNA helicase, putative [Trypanosoma brucei gambiense DAL972]|uniref:Probable eukaryotic initiation factor 4A n=2 Tax=Trypanosoma brucei TaxID=5691 RepID=C9ZMQ4_TRYB9|nr:ATP-dependent DEAD/H RNA helicase, putative [Trypanosoma brucei gambiense DAL972]RHW72719.1 ATP-dependent DEAD/H RNA helicase [Trypanosoma brucei equiperdum]CBH10557.1 ATP-dependent DEAD/H RNA helicase, putative [Trypanosoma brucei gambiense DAL972]|eukprot:XP_011772846.1 ATP-dependent DEAD/H RNA helicase, putative [Trypanosoma brucei gambiense DAL972]